MDDSIVLKKISEVIDEHVLEITEDDILNFLKIRNRWPSKYHWNQSSIEIITQFKGKSQEDFFDSLGIFNYDKWIEYYNLGFTTIISNVLDLNQQLRDLQKKVLEYTGTKVNGNFYFSLGSSKHTVSFVPHKHPYHVIVKPIYGKSKWKVSEKKFELSKKSFIINAGEEHSVYECTDKKLSLTLSII
jgi:hypothetical protein